MWDSVAQTRSDAMKAVAGHDSDAEWDRAGRSTADDIVAETGLTAADTVLDIGCGAGRVGVHVAPRCRRGIGADVSREMLGHTRAALGRRGNVELVHLTGDGLPASLDGTVDVVYCTTVFMHLEEWDRYRYIQGAFRVLKPGGRLYVDSFSLLSEDGWALFEQMAQAAAGRAAAAHQQGVDAAGAADVRGEGRLRGDPRPRRAAVRDRHRARKPAES